VVLCKQVDHQSYQNKYCENRSKTNKAPLSQSSLTTNGSQIYIVDFDEYLSVFIDKDLDFNEHIKVLESKVACAVGILSKLKRVFPPNAMLQFYLAWFIRCCLMTLTSGEPLILLRDFNFC